MDLYLIASTPHKGLGVFAARAIREDELLFQIDLRSRPQYSLRDIAALSPWDNDHSDYVGRGRYAVDDSPASYMNHSCEPTCYYHMRSIAMKDVYAARDLVAGDELTHDYAATSVDQFAGRSTWVLACRCGSSTCRGQVTGDFFALSEDWQRQHYVYLAPSIKRKYRDRLCALFQAEQRS
jgi:SET domain-containing protein